MTDMIINEVIEESSYDCDVVSNLERFFNSVEDCSNRLLKSLDKSVDNINNCFVFNAFKHQDSTKGDFESCLKNFNCAYGELVERKNILIIYFKVSNKKIQPIINILKEIKIKIEQLESLYKCIYK